MVIDIQVCRKKFSFKHFFHTAISFLIVEKDAYRYIYICYFGLSIFFITIQLSDVRPQLQSAMATSFVIQARNLSEGATVDMVVMMDLNWMETKF